MSDPKTEAQVLADEMKTLGYVEFGDCLSLVSYNLIIAALRAAPVQRSDAARAWPVRIDKMLAAMSRAAHVASDSNADLLPSYRKDIDLIQAIRSDLLAAIASRPQCDAVTASEPAADRTVVWIAFAGNGNVRFWTNDKSRADLERGRGMDLRAFTLAELVALTAVASPPPLAAREALEAIDQYAKTIRNSHKLIGPSEYFNDAKAMKIWQRALYHEGKTIEGMVKAALRGTELSQPEKPALAPPNQGAGTSPSIPSADRGGK